MGIGKSGYRYEVISLPSYSGERLRCLNPNVQGTNFYDDARTIASEKGGVIWDEDLGLLTVDQVPDKFGPEQMALIAWCYGRYVAEGV